MSTQTKAQEFALFGGGRLIVAPTHAKDVVTIQGSVLGGPNYFSSDERVVPGLGSTLLDAGTRTKSKDVIREGLAERGMSLSFSAGGDRVNFSAQCFPEDVSKLLAIIAECLGEASFPEQEVATAKAVLLAELEEERSDTRARAERALAGLLYDPAHPHYARPLEEVRASVERITRADLQAFRKRLGKAGLLLVVAGDVEAEAMPRVVEIAFSRLGIGESVPPVKPINAKAVRASEVVVPIADKANVDFRLGVAVPITLLDPQYRPLFVLTQMLGSGTFDSHLMKTIRDRDGLTYGIWAQLTGFAYDTDGYFRLGATFSPLLYGQAVVAVRRELKEFLTRGLTDKAFKSTKERLAGSYKVSLATTRGLAVTLHNFARNGYAVSYLTEYPKLIEQVTLKEVKEAATLIPLDKLTLAAAGTFTKK